MKPKDVQEAVKSLQQYLLDEYGWEPQKSRDNPSPECATTSEITRKLEAEYLSSRLPEPGKNGI